MKLSGRKVSALSYWRRWGILLAGCILLWGCNPEGVPSYEPAIGYQPLPANADLYLNTDSILQVIEGYPNDAMRVDSLLAYADWLQNYDETVALVYAQMVDRIAQKNKWNKEKAFANYFIGLLQGRKKNLEIGNEDAMIEAKIGIKAFESINNKPWQARTLSLVGFFFVKRQQPDSARFHYRKALNLIETGLMDKKDSISLRAEVLHELAILHSEENPSDTTTISKLFLESLELYQLAGYSQGVARVKLELGYLARKRKDYLEANRYYQESILHSLSTNDNKHLVIGYQRLGSLRIAQFKAIRSDSLLLPEALSILRKCLRYQKKNFVFTYNLMANTYQNRALYELSIGSEKVSSFVDSALLYNKKAMEEARKEGAFPLMRNVARNISTLCSYLKTNEKRDCREILGASPTDLFYYTYTGIVDTMTKSLKGANQRIRDDDVRRTKENAAQERNSLILIGVLIFLVGLLGLFIWRTREQRQKLNREKSINDRLQRVDKLKDQFLANTSHELRTPLNGIIGLSESLIERVGEPSQKEDLSLIVSSGKRLSSLVDDLLDFSKLKNYDIELQRKPLDLHSLTEVVLRISVPLTSGRDIQLVNAISEDLSAVYADEDRLQQILHNLVGNAIKFTQVGKVEVVAYEDPANPGKMMKIQVSDTGIGIPKEKHQTIFEEFQQADGSTSREFGGTGLGLTVTRQLVHLHKGEIGVESEPGKGTTFWFTLPISREKGMISKLLSGTTEILRPRVSTLPELETQVQQPATEDQVRILIVDDEPINQQVLKNHLQDPRFQIEFASNGEETLEVLEKSPNFDLVLLDVMMPKMSGYEACERIREHFLPSELPIIMVTAKNQVEDLVQGLNLGANDYLAKPFTRQEFLARVQTQLDLHRIFYIADRFVPNEFIRALGHERITDTQLGDQTERKVTVMFCDIRGYTPLAETMTPEENFKFVNSFHGRLGPVIKEHNGFVNQYLGDGFMAIFPGNPQEALTAAVKMRKILATYNEERVSRGRAIIRVGIGMHYGPLIMGIIGDQKRMDAATISDTVNTASRVESLTKHYGSSLLVTAACLNEMPNPEEFHVRYLGPVKVKGKKELIRIYDCFDGDDPGLYQKKHSTLEDFGNATQKYFAKDFAAAIATFDQIVKQHPEDTVAQHFLQKTGRMLHEGVPEDWNGVEEMTKK